MVLEAKTNYLREEMMKMKKKKEISYASLDIHLKHTKH